MGISSRVLLAKGQTVMLTKNISVDTGLVNGCVGEIKDFYKIDLAENVDEIDFVIVEFMNYVGNRYICEENNRLVPIRRELCGNEAYNFPLVAATAITIHKSKGSTFECEVFVDIRDREVLGSTFVALSRVTKFENLYLRAFDFERYQKIREVGYFEDRVEALKRLEEIEF